MIKTVNIFKGEEMNKSFMPFSLLVIISISLSTIDASETKINQAQRLSWEGKYNEAIIEYNKILSTDPENIEALDGKAETLSWRGQYKESIETYNKLLVKRYSAKIARQKARVLCWTQDFRGAIFAYQEAYEKTKDEGTRLEGLAKKAWWDGHILTAINYYEELLKIEPDNLEARSDLAQIESYEGLPEKAIENYEYITARHKWHFRAQEGLEKTNIVYEKASLTPTFFWFSSTSPSRDTYIRRFYSEILFNIPIQKHYSFLLGYNLDNFNYPNSSIVRHYGVMGLKASLNARLWLNTLYGVTAYTSNSISSQKYSAQLGFKPLEPVTLTIVSKRDDLINNKTVLVKGLHATDIGINAMIKINRFTQTTLEYKQSFINDKNTENYLSYEQQLFFLKAPTELTLIGGINYQDWKTVAVDYFSPQHFWSVPVTLRWRHYLNKNDLYYGARDTYYGVRYKFQVDKGTTIFNGGGIEFHHDFSNRIGLHIETFGNYSNVYKDFGVFLGFVGYFL